MSKIQLFDKVNLQEVRRALEEAIAPVNEKYGIVAKLGSFRYTPDGLTFKTQLDVTIEGIGKKDYSEEYPWMNLPKLGTEFMMQGRRFRVIEHIPSRPKFPVIGEEIGKEGKRYKFQVSQIKVA